MKKFEQGALAGLALEGLWELYPGKHLFQVEQNPLAFLEHYHWGMGFILADKALNLRGFGKGAGAVFILSEFLHANPFGIGKDPSLENGNVGTAMVLLGLSLAAYLA